jgi:hypothetical protein
MNFTSSFFLASDQTSCMTDANRSSTAEESRSTFVGHAAQSRCVKESMPAITATETTRRGFGR